MTRRFRRVTPPRRLLELDIGNHQLDVAVAVVSVYLRLIGEVEELVFQKLLF